MERNSVTYRTYVDILREELVPAAGCTEPVAIAYCAAYARDLLGAVPERVTVRASGNMIKNAKSVIVPNTGGMRGIPAAVAAGIVAGKTERRLEVISGASSSRAGEIRDYLNTHAIEVALAETGLSLDCELNAYAGTDSATVRIANKHTNVVLAKKNGRIILECPEEGERTGEGADRGLLNIRRIIEFADTLCVEDVRDIIERQIEYNSAVAQEGLRNFYGANVGKVLLQACGDRVEVRAKAMAAAASDARMNGCELPIVIVSGSGNQGITASIPVIVFAEELGCSRESLIRALVVSNLATIHQKSSIGRLSAFCGAVSAGAGSGAGVCYLKGGGYQEITHAIVNTLAIASGMICDGAKSSCAAKIAIAVESGLLGCSMYMLGQQFRAGDGIISKGVENTIRNVGRVGRDGMRETDSYILEIMTENPKTGTRRQQSRSAASGGPDGK